MKAFSIYGFENFEDNVYPAFDAKPAMLFCGRDAAAKQTVGALIAELGWEPVDVGGLEQALHLEHMTLLWVRMVRVDGASPQMVWARLRRWRTSPSASPSPATSAWLGHGSHADRFADVASVSAPAGRRPGGPGTRRA